MRALRLVGSPTPWQSLTDGLESILDTPMSITHGIYAIGAHRYRMVYLNNEYNGAEIRIIHVDDRDQDISHRLGIHSKLSKLDEYELSDLCEEAFDQGFDTIWLT